MMQEAKEIFCKLFKPGHVDHQVDAITESNRQVFLETARSAKRSRDLYRKNGVTFQIMIGAVGDKHD